MVRNMVDQKRNGTDTEQQTKKYPDIQGGVIWNISSPYYWKCNSICGKSDTIQSSPLGIPNG